MEKIVEARTARGQQEKEIETRIDEHAFSLSSQKSTVHPLTYLD